MSDTTTPAELHIPDAAADHHFTCGCSDSGCSRAGYQSDAIPIIVAAELRRLADTGYWCDDMDIAQSVERVLRARADELDPQP